MKKSKSRRKKKKASNHFLRSLCHHQKTYKSVLKKSFVLIFKYLNRPSIGYNNRAIGDDYFNKITNFFTNQK